MLKQPTSELKAWLELSEEWITESIKQKQQDDIRGTRSMKHYFNRK
jgi:hypothetical protein